MSKTMSSLAMRPEQLRMKQLCRPLPASTQPGFGTPRNVSDRSQWRMQAFGGLFGGGKGKGEGSGKAKACKKCKSTGSITCPGCKGSGRNKANGNVFERWKCYDCQGFGQVACPACGGKGLTPEQRGER